MNHLHPRLGPQLASSLTSSSPAPLEQHALIDCIDEPARLRRLPVASLQALSREVRNEMIASVSKTGGHLGSGLGTVELTVALHYVFETPIAKLIWDVSHQCYPHKILTGRRNRMGSLRKQGGLAGFTSRAESPFDPFGAAHSSTAISAGLGFAAARDLAGDDYDIVSIVGDGAMSGGMAFEGLNNLGAQRRRMIVVINDNDMSIAPPSGALSEHLRELRRQMPEAGERKRRIAIEGLPAFSSTPTLFDQFRCRYAGPFDGHDVEEMVDVLSSARQHDGPLVLHILTNKGHGYEPAAKAADRYHGVARFDPDTGAQHKPKPKSPTYTNVFASTLSELADRDPRIVAVTAAMPSGTGLDKFGARHPDRCFDTGIAEQHAVTFCAGLAADGFAPFAAIYSTFLQRAYDQVVHDVAIQKLPVRFAIDRAGMVGADGVTHQGSYDTTYLGCLPNFVLMAAGDEAELARMVATAAAIDDRPSAFRYPRGEGVGTPIPETLEPLEIGRGRIVKEGTDVAILTFGAPLQNALAAAEQLDGEGISATVADARFAKPVDADLIRRLCTNHAGLVVVEEGAIGGFTAQVRHCLDRLGIAPRGMKELHLPDHFIEHAGRDFQLEAGGIAAGQIRAAAASLIN